MKQNTTLRLDRVATELEQAGRPDMALTLDRISDRLDKTASYPFKIGKEYELLTDNHFFNVYLTYDGKKGELFELLKKPIAPVVLKSKSSGEKVIWNRTGNRVSREKASPENEFKEPRTEEWWETRSNNEYVLKKGYSFLVYDNIPLKKGSKIKFEKILENINTPNNIKKIPAILMSFSGGKIYEELSLMDDKAYFNGTFKAVDMVSDKSSRIIKSQFSERSSYIILTERIDRIASELSKVLK